MCIEYHIEVNMYHMNAQGVDERMINVHYYYYYFSMKLIDSFKHQVAGLPSFCVPMYNLFSTAFLPLPHTAPTPGNVSFRWESFRYKPRSAFSH